MSNNIDNITGSNMPETAQPSDLSTSSEQVPPPQPLSLEVDAPQKEPSANAKEIGQFRAILRAVFSKEGIQLLLSHHPNCEKYESHVFKIGRLRLCKGCILSYPPAYTIILMYIFWNAARTFLLTKSFRIANIYWFVIGFGVLTLGGYALKKYSRIINDFTKLFRGILAGFLVASVFAATTWYYAIIPALLFFTGLAFLSLKRGKEMDTTCKECEWHGNFETCPGFRGFYERLTGGTTKDQQPAGQLEPTQQQIAPSKVGSDAASEVIAEKEP
ncbi:MAG: hypothetical protein ACTSXO_04390 [Candidatus Heimdallarchaeota archaeon]